MKNLSNVALELLSLMQGGMMVYSTAYYFDTDHYQQHHAYYVRRDGGAVAFNELATSSAGRGESEFLYVGRTRNSSEFGFDLNLAFAELIEAGLVTRKGAYMHFVAGYAVSVFEATKETEALEAVAVATGSDDVQGDEGAAEAAPTITGTPNPLTDRESSKAHAKAQRYAEMFKRSPRTKLAHDLAGAIGDQQQELALYVAIEVVEQARHFLPHDRTELAAYNELREAMAKTDAPLPDVRKFMAQAAESFGY